MSVVIDMRTLQRIDVREGETVEQQINRRVLAQLRGRAKGETIAVAQRRALRIIREEPRTTVGQAVQRGIAFAVCNEDPPPAAA